MRSTKQVAIGVGLLLLPVAAIGALWLVTRDWSPATYPKQLADGCYYAQGKPVFKVAGNQGRVLIPGEVRTFRVDRGGNPFRAYAIFSPGFLFNEADLEGPPKTVDAWYDRRPWTYSMKSGTSVPTVEMHWAAFGDEDVYLGGPC